MKIKLTISFILLVCFATAQTKILGIRDKLGRFILKPYFEIDSTNVKFYYKYSNQLLKFDNCDSSFKALKIIHCLNRYDTNNYKPSLFEKQIKKVHKKFLNNYTGLLQGSWKFNYGFTNWDFESKVDSIKKIVVKGNDIVFYKNDTLYRKTRFNLKSNYIKWYPERVCIIYLTLLDKNEDWVISVEPDKLNRNKLSLLISFEPDCSCGCYQEFYEREIENL